MVKRNVAEIKKRRASGKIRYAGGLGSSVNAARSANQP
jgi:hypothetical protein